MKPASILLFSALALAGAPAAAQAAGTLGQPGCLIVKADPAPKEKAQWSGPCQDGYAHGDGKLTWFLGAVPNGFFEGRMEKGLPREGYEKAADGGQYEGQYKNGLRDGMGTYVSKLDDRYTGMWKEGKRHGKGKASYGMGGAFEGNWQADKPDGPGKLTWAGGRTADNVEHPPLSPQGEADEAEKSTKARYAFRDGVRDPFYTRLPRRDSHTSATVPFKLTYAELSASQRAVVRENYPLLHEEDEPPYPIKGEQAMTSLVIQATQLRESLGNLSARVTVAPNGMPRAVTVFESPDPEMEKFLIHVIMNERYKPGLCAGKPCEMFFFYSYLFRRG